MQKTKRLLALLLLLALSCTQAHMPDLVDGFDPADDEAVMYQLYLQSLEDGAVVFTPPTKPRPTSNNRTQTPTRQEQTTQDATKKAQHKRAQQELEKIEAAHKETARLHHINRLQGALEQEKQDLENKKDDKAANLMIATSEVIGASLIAGVWYMGKLFDDATYGAIPALAAGVLTSVLVIDSLRHYKNNPGIKQEIAQIKANIESKEQALAALQAAKK